MTEVTDSKKIAAVMAAVEMYLQEEAAVVQGGVMPGIMEPSLPPAPVKLWGN